VRSHVAAAGLIVALATACDSGPVTESAIGAVAEIRPGSVCLDEGGPIGICYQADQSQVRGLRVGDCVEISAIVKIGRAYSREATAIKAVPAAEHSAECPSG
jgi:hypothetical protein